MRSLFEITNTKFSGRQPNGETLDKNFIVLLVYLSLVLDNVLLTVVGN